MQSALLKEVGLRGGELNEEINTIYLGGGTPSMLDSSFMTTLLNHISGQFKISGSAEITLEANPEDLTKQKLAEFKQIGINRLSIGIQSFQDVVLNWMNRIHNSDQAKKALINARNAGFDNISLDLIFAVPHAAYDLYYDVTQCLDFAPQHISTYNLTIEPETVFGRQLQKNQLTELDQDRAADQYLYIIEALEKSGYEHYEVSNFGMPGYRSQHNQSYWQQKPYLGIGPGAHSFDGSSRQFNIAHNHKYMQAINNGTIPFEREELTWQQQCSEQIMTGLRTNTGVNLMDLRQRFDYDLLQQQASYCRRLIDDDFAFVHENHLILKLKGKLIADQIAADLYVTHD